MSDSDHHHGDHVHTADGGHGHSHGLVDRSIVRSREGVRAVAASLAVLARPQLRKPPSSCCPVRWRCWPI
jgi:hypothetical protein